MLGPRLRRRSRTGRRSAAGDQLALHALYERAHRPVFTLIMRITANRETAEELAFAAGGSTSRAGAGPMLVSLGAAVTSSSTSIAARPVSVMRSAIAPLSPSRRQTR